MTSTTGSSSPTEPGATATVDVRRAAERFPTDLGWLDSKHSFSFGGHFDPDNVGHGLLIVSNDDVVAAGGGFGTHPHRDMEIVTWVLDGELEHRDSAGNEGVLYPGLAQRMSAGRGIFHSEMNHSQTEPVHFVQMWGRTSIGFLPHNFHPARIFMGDSGALLLGLLMASSTMSVGGRVVDQFSGQVFFFFAPMVIPVVVLGVPLFDSVWAAVRRARSGAPVTQADKNHLHHRLMRLGHGHRRSVLILWGWTALLSGVVLYPTVTGDGDGIVPFAVAALGLLLYTMFSRGLRGTPTQDAA